MSSSSSSLSASFSKRSFSSSKEIRLFFNKFSLWSAVAAASHFRFFPPLVSDFSVSKLMPLPAPRHGVRISGKDELVAGLILEGCEGVLWDPGLDATGEDNAGLMWGERGT